MHVITGGAGFIGSALLWRLNELGLDEIVIVDNLDHGPKWRNLVKRRYADYIRKDRFMDLASRGALPWKLESVAHLGACSSTVETDSGYLMENNFHYSRDLCRIALEAGARFVNASSAATYGAGELGFSTTSETLPRLRPLNMYGYSKQLFDLWLARENLAGAAASLKFFNVYGPNEYHKGDMKSVAAKIYGEIAAEGRARLFASSDPAMADGGQMRDFVYVKDCVDLLARLLLERRDICGILNVGSGRARTFNDLAAAVFAAMGKPFNVEYKPIPASIAGNYQNYTRADMSWLAETGCQAAFHSLEEGIDDYVRNYLAKKDMYL